MCECVVVGRPSMKSVCTFPKIEISVICFIVSCCYDWCSICEWLYRSMCPSCADILYYIDECNRLSNIVTMSIQSIYIVGRLVIIHIDILFIYSRQVEITRSIWVETAYILSTTLRPPYCACQLVGNTRSEDNSFTWNYSPAVREIAHLRRK